MVYRIQRVAALTGISPATLRAWERRHRLIAPKRTAKGYRLYSDEQVATLSRIKSLVDGGLKIGEAVAVVRGKVASLSSADEAAIRDARAELLEALLSLDRAASRRIFDRLSALPAERTAEDVLLPLMREVGDLWACGSATVVQEHFASAFVRERFDAMLTVLNEAEAGEREAICAGIPGERHELGLTAAALLLAVHRWRVINLGPEVPTAELHALLQSRRPELFCTSIVAPLSIGRFRQLVCELRAMAPAATRVVIGGKGIPDEAFADPPAGVTLMKRLAELRTEN